MNVEVRLRIEACRPIVAVEAVPMPYMTEAARVHLLLPVAGVDEAPAALRFVDDWGADAAPAKSGDVHLTLVVFHRPADAGADVLKELARHVQRHNGRKKDVRISTFQLPANYDPTVKPMYPIYERTRIRFFLLESAVIAILTNSKLNYCPYTYSWPYSSRCLINHRPSQWFLD